MCIVLRMVQWLYNNILISYVLQVAGRREKKVEKYKGMREGALVSSIRRCDDGESNNNILRLTRCARLNTLIKMLRSMKGK